MRLIDIRDSFQLLIPFYQTQTYNFFVTFDSYKEYTTASRPAISARGMQDGLSRNPEGRFFVNTLQVNKLAENMLMIKYYLCIHVQKAHTFFVGLSRDAHGGCDVLSEGKESGSGQAHR